MPTKIQPTKNLKNKLMMKYKIKNSYECLSFIHNRITEIVLPARTINQSQVSNNTVVL